MVVAEEEAVCIEEHLEQVERIGEQMANEWMQQESSLVLGLVVQAMESEA